MVFGSVPNESRSGDRCDQIRRAGVFFVLAALRRWQAVLHVMALELSICLNKVRKGSFEVGLSGQLWLRVALLLLATLPWWELLVKERAGSFFNKAKSLVFGLFLHDLPPLARGFSLEFDGESMLICWLEARFVGARGLKVSCLLWRGGSGEEHQSFGSTASWGKFLAAKFGDPQWQRLCAVYSRPMGPLRAMV